MMWQPVRPLGMVMVALGTLVPLESGRADEAARVQAAVREMDVWLGDDEPGRRWKEFLESDELRDQLDRGAQADRSTVREILHIYRGETPGLERDPFVAVRDALEEWLATLPLPADALASEALSWRNRYRAVTAAEVAQHRSALRAAWQRLDRFLARATPENAAQWKRYLKWQIVETELAEQGPPDLAALESVLTSLYGNHEGLGLPQFTSARSALREYMNAALFYGAEQVEQVYGTRIDELAALVREAQSEWSHERATSIGRILGWLESGNQARPLVEAVRNQYWQENLYALVSQELMAVAIQDDVDEYQPVREFIMGTTIRGTAHVIGQLDLELIPNDERASFDIVLQGTAYSDNVGYNGPVTIYSSGVTGLQATKRVYVDEQGFRWDGARASGWTSSTIHSIAARSKLVRRLAWRRAGATKSQVEGIAAGRASSRVAAQVDSQAAALLSDVNRQYENKVRRPLLRLDAFPRMVRLATGARALRLRLLHATPYQLAAPATPPPIPDGHDLSVRAHESVVGNIAESILGGRTLTDERLVELLGNAGADVPEELTIRPDTDPWSISFSGDQPIRVLFRDNRVRIGIRGRRFTRGDQEIRDTIEIAATYTLESVGSGSRLTRQGDVEVRYVNRDSLSIQQVAMRTFLARKFDALFKPEIVSEGLLLPGRWKEVGRLSLRGLAAEGGWLALDWEAPSETVRTARAD